MTQLTLTDDRIQDAPRTTDPDNETPDEPAAPELPPSGINQDQFNPVAEHPAVADVNLAGMELSTNADGYRDFPHPAEIWAHLDEDMDADTASFPEEVRTAIDSMTDEPEIGEFLVFDATDAYEYLETLQKKSDLHLENFHRRQLVVNQLSNGRGYAKGSSLSTYDKKWICQWEVTRRLAERDFDKWGGSSPLSKENSGLPNA